MLGLALARRITDKVAYVVTGCAGIYAAVAAAIGLDTLAVPLFLVITVAWFILPAHRRLYAGTFIVSLGLELYGTWLGNWSWAVDVPGMPLMTTNPPGTAGAFYCALDALVVGVMLIITPGNRARGLDLDRLRLQSHPTLTELPAELYSALSESGSAVSATDLGTRGKMLK